MVSREMREMSPMDFTQRFGEFPSREGLTILVVSERFDLHMMWTNAAVCGEDAVNYYYLSSIHLYSFNLILL